MSNDNILARIVSDKGFYVGDICYVLDDETYDKVWGGTGYKDGVHTDPATGFSFAVAGTAYGDGTYFDDCRRAYDVDAGVIGLVPAELVKKDTGGGHFFECAGEAIFIAKDGRFTVELPMQPVILIDTTGEDEIEDDYYEDDYEEEEW